MSAPHCLFGPHVFFVVCICAVYVDPVAFPYTQELLGAQFQHAEMEEGGLGSYGLIEL